MKGEPVAPIILLSRSQIGRVIRGSRCYRLTIAHWGMAATYEYISTISIFIDSCLFVLLLALYFILSYVFGLWGIWRMPRSV